MQNQTIILFVVAGVCLLGGVAHFVSTPTQEPPTLAASNLETSFTPTRKISADKISSIATKILEPMDALIIGEHLFATDPTDREGRLAGFLCDLCRSGKFETALQLADEAPADMRGGFLKIVFNDWAQSRPQDAVKALDQIGDTNLHSVALRAIADGWNTTSPGDLAAYANALPVGDDRNYALALALDNWSLQDPAALGAWLNTLPRGAEFDYGAALMIAKSDSANRPPELAMQWVENIGNPALKQDLFARVLGEWSQSDPAAAQHYVAAAAWLAASQRHEILERFFAAR